MQLYRFPPPNQQAAARQNQHISQSEVVRIPSHYGGKGQDATGIADRSAGPGRLAVWGAMGIRFFSFLGEFVVRIAEFFSKKADFDDFALFSKKCSSELRRS